jgi:hypothetical protein
MGRDAHQAHEHLKAQGPGRGHGLAPPSPPEQVEGCVDGYWSVEDVLQSITRREAHKEVL